MQDYHPAVVSPEEVLCICFLRRFVVCLSHFWQNPAGCRFFHAIPSGHDQRPRSKIGAGVQKIPAWVCPQKATRPLVLAVGFGFQNSCDWEPTEVLAQRTAPRFRSLGIVLQLILSFPPSFSRTPNLLFHTGPSEIRAVARAPRAREGRYQLSLVLWAPVRTLPANKCCAVLGSVGLLAPKGRDTSNYRQDPEGRGRKWKEAGPRSRISPATESRFWGVA